jgi:hypothetical protein
MTRRLLRGEGLGLFAVAVAAYYGLGGPLVPFLLAFLLPDLGMLGYLLGPRIGSYTYNATHWLVGPAALGGLGVSTGTEVAVLAALIWAAHVGFDRALGYGLKRPTAFGDTHLGRVGRIDPEAAGVDGTPGRTVE